MSEFASGLVAERYELLEQAGAGAMGRIYRARDVRSGRIVAVKLLRPGHDECARARLRAEAQIVSRLSHPCIAGVIEHGEQLVDGESVPYVVMEFIEGVTLREALREGPLSPERVSEVLADVAQALAHAHAAGVIHRDVKPANIMLTEGGGAVLLDFGIARHSDLEPLTMTGAILGTATYLSPEQALGEGATPRSDLYSLGVLAHEALTGQRPLVRDTEVATLLAHVSEDVPQLPRWVPRDLRRLVDQMTRRSPEERPESAAEVARRARRRFWVGDRFRAPVAAGTAG